MKNQLINFIFLLVFVIGSMSFYPLVQEEDGGEQVVVQMKTTNYEFQIPGKFVLNNQLTMSLIITLRNQANGNTYSMATTSMVIIPSWNLNGTFDLKLEIGGHVQVQEVNL